MSTGKRLAKRSIIGTRVSAPGGDGMYYSGVIHVVKSPASAAAQVGLPITSSTLYMVNFDKTGGKPPSDKTEFSRCDLIGPGFASMMSTSLNAGQKVYLTYNGREIQAEVIEHRKQIDEVDILIAPNGRESKMTLTKRIDEIRLTQSRKSPRLADQDTDFARLADMAGDRKRAASHSIDVPHVPGSRKRRPSSSNDSEKSYGGGGGSGGVGTGWSETTRVPRGCGRVGCRTNERGDCMDECTAALVLMSLSCSPHSPNNPLPLHCQHNYGSWEGRGTGSVVAGSPGVGGASNSSSSSSGASWRTGTPSPPLSDSGATIGSIWPAPPHHPSHNQLQCSYSASGSPSGSTPSSTGTLDEGIVPDYLEDMHPRKKKKSRARVNRDLVENGTSEGYNFENWDRAKPPPVFQCTWPKCHEIKATEDLIEQHVRQLHLGPKPKKEPEDGEDWNMSEGEEAFYYREVEVKHMSSPPTMSHRDMARPPHEDPEYQKQLRLEAAPIAVINNNNNNNNNNNSSQSNNNNNTVENRPVTGSVIRENTNTVLAFGLSQSSQQQNTSLKHIKLSPRQLQVCQQQNVGLLTVTTGKLPASPRKVRGDTKKCRKIYGMDNRDLWCTQCKWKKACTRFCEFASST